MNHERGVMKDLLAHLSNLRKNLSREEQELLDAIVLSAPDEVYAHSLTEKPVAKPVSKPVAAKPVDEDEVYAHSLTEKPVAKPVSKPIAAKPVMDEDEVELHSMKSKPVAKPVSRNVSISLDEKGVYKLND